MFCQNPACGTEVASSYKICPSCGGMSFGQKQVEKMSAPPLPSPVGSKIADLNSHDGGANTNKLLPQNLNLVAIGIVVLLALAVVGYQFIKEAKFQRQQEIAKIEIERKRIAEEEARQRQAEIERLAEAATKAKKEQESLLSREAENKSLSIVERKGSEILDLAYPLAFGRLVYKSAESRGVTKTNDAYTATIRLHYLNLLNTPHYLDMAFTYSEKGEFVASEFGDYSDFIAPGKLTLATLFQLTR